jgi:hypothetical protein
MALPNLARVWQFQVNNVVASDANNTTQNRALMLALKQALIGAGSWTDGDGFGLGGSPNGWTVVGSSDGSASSMDGTDRWLSGSNLVWASAGTAHSWIVLQSPTGLQLLIDLVNVTITSATFIVSHTGFGTANGGTNGSSTTAPTALNSVTILSNTNWGGASTPAATVLHVQHSTTIGGIAGTRAFMCRNGQAVSSLILENPVAEAVSGWAGQYYALAFGVLAAAPSGRLLSEANVADRTAAAGRSFGAGAFAIGAVTEGFPSGAGPDQLTAQNSFSGEFPLFPVRVASNVASNAGTHGLITDLWRGLRIQATGTTFPATPSATREFAVMDAFIIAWNKSLPNVAP